MNTSMFVMHLRRVEFFIHQSSFGPYSITWNEIRVSDQFNSALKGLLIGLVVYTVIPIVSVCCQSLSAWKARKVTKHKTKTKINVPIEPQHVASATNINFNVILQPHSYIIKKENQMFNLLWDSSWMFSLMIIGIQSVLLLL